MSTASFKLKGQRLVGKWISIEYEEDGKPVWYKARVDTYGGAQKYEVTWEAGGSEWLAKPVFLLSRPGSAAHRNSSM